eukprot:scaffold48164_cov13-Tisochrysis_lutea.AAC.1
MVGVWADARASRRVGADVEGGAAAALRASKGVSWCRSCWACCRKESSWDGVYRLRRRGWGCR